MPVYKAPIKPIYILPVPDTQELRMFADGRNVPARYKDVEPELIAQMFHQITATHQNAMHDDWERDIVSPEFLNDLHNAEHGFRRYMERLMFDEAVGLSVKTDFVASVQDLESLIHEQLPTRFGKLSTVEIISCIVQSDPHGRLENSPYIHLKRDAYLKVRQVQAQAEKKLDELEEKNQRVYSTYRHTPLFAKLLTNEALRRVDVVMNHDASSK